MGAEGKQSGVNGKFDEYGNRIRVLDTRTKWEAFRDGIYNPTEKTFLGRTKKRWGIFGVFYLAFYTMLALLCSVCFMGLMATIDEHRPTYTLDSSLIGTNPGLGFRPQPEPVLEGSTIEYTSSNASHIEKWTSRLDEFLEVYTNKSKLPNGGRNQMICDYTKPLEPGKVCAVDVTNLRDCTKARDYGYRNSAPCVLIKLNKIFDWKPDFYNEPEQLPEEMPQELKNYIRGVSKVRLNTVWVSCNGETAKDKENIGRLQYYPQPGFPGYYYPFENSPDYLSPVVAVQFERPKTNVTINVECKAWAKNIQYASRRGEKRGSVHFELKIHV